MALPFKKAGGGFLNNVPGVIVGGAFDLDLQGGSGDSAWRKLNAKLLIQLDGATEPVETYVDGGFIHDEAITVSGFVISGTEECPIRENSELAGLVGSMVESTPGLDETEVGNLLDYGFLLGLRVNFVKVPDVERNAKDGGRKDKKTGKVWPHELLRVNKVFGRVDIGKTAGKTAGAPKTASKPKATKTAAPAAPAAPAASSDDLTGIAEKALATIVSDAKDNKVAKTALAALFVRFCAANSIEQAQREAARNILTSPAFLAAQVETGVYKDDGKVISIAA